MAVIIAVSNQKGGVGKTTTAINLAHCVSCEERRVLLVDVDPQGSATSGLGARDDRKPGLYDVLMNGLPAKEAIRNSGFGALDILPAGIDLAGAEIELVEMEDRENLLRKALESVKNEYDYIIVDCPPSLGLLTLNALIASDGVIVPIQCEYCALEGVGQIMNTIKMVRRRLNPGLTLKGIILTMYDSRTNLNRQVADEVRSHFPDETFEITIPRNVRLSEAPSYGMPICEYDAKCPGARAYQELALELILREEHI